MPAHRGSAGLAEALRGQRRPGPPRGTGAPPGLARPGMRARAPAPLFMRYPQRMRAVRLLLI
jgi:hypothetical protein